MLYTKRFSETKSLGKIKCRPVLLLQKPTNEKMSNKGAWKKQNLYFLIFPLFLWIVWHFLHDNCLHREERKQKSSRSTQNVEGRKENILTLIYLLNTKHFVDFYKIVLFFCAYVVTLLMGLILSVLYKLRFVRFCEKVN